jgi:hypothetical protein
MTTQENQSLDGKDRILGTDQQLLIGIHTDGGETGEPVLEQQQSGLARDSEAVSSLPFTHKARNVKRIGRNLIQRSRTLPDQPVVAQLVKKFSHFIIS